MLEITRANPFNGEDTNEIYDITSLDELESLPFIEAAVINGWVVSVKENKFVYLQHKNITVKVASVRERNGTGK